MCASYVHAAAGLCPHFLPLMVDGAPGSNFKTDSQIHQHLRDRTLTPCGVWGGESRPKQTGLGAGKQRNREWGIFLSIFVKVLDSIRV